MFEIKDMESGHREQVLCMVDEFYHSDAVDHVIGQDVRKRAFEAAVSQDPMIRGVVLLEDGQVVGYAYLTFFYSCEVAGKNLLLEELFLKDTCRGKGYGTAFFDWLFREYPDVARFRLEVTEANEGASALYEKLGFTFLDYRQMVRDVPAGGDLC